MVDKPLKPAKAESASVPAVIPTVAPGSRALRHRVHERYCRYRSEGLHRLESYKRAVRYQWKTGRRMLDDHGARVSANRLEKRQEIVDRIQYLIQDAASIIAAKRKRLEEALWSMHEADIGDLFETYEKTEKIGDTIKTYKANRPKLLEDIPVEVRKNIERLNIDGRGRIVPQLYSKLAASQELRKMLEIGKTDDRTDVQRLTDQELIASLADQAKQLGLNINLNYSFAQKPQEDDNATTEG